MSLSHTRTQCPLNVCVGDIERERIINYQDFPRPLSHSRAISEESVGHKMLKKLGWRKGEGLGKGSKGRTEPVSDYSFRVHTRLL